MRLLKGLYYYLRHSKSIPFPLTLDGWKLFASVCHSWSEGYPSSMQFGAYMILDMPPTEDTVQPIVDLLRYQEKLTDRTLALFQVYPIDAVQVIEGLGGTDDPLNQKYTVGWKKEYAWEPI